jgi:hypothetical protein
MYSEISKCKNNKCKNRRKITAKWLGDSEMFGDE